MSGMAEKKAYPALIRNIVDRYKYVLLIAALGIALLCWPTDKPEAELPEASPTASEPVTEEVEEKLEYLLSLIEGVGEVEVMLTLASGPEWIYADEKTLSSDTDAGTSAKTSSQTQYVVVRDSEGNEKLVLLREKYAQYKGALVVCRGAADATVRLAVVNAVRSVTGLSADRITVEKMR